MPNLDLQVRMDGADPTAAMPEITRAELRETLKQFAVEGEELVKSEIEEVGAYDQGTLIRSVESAASGSSATIRVTAPHAQTVDQGRRPGQKPPPAVALLGWMVRHGLDTSQAVGLAIAIGRRGIKARPYLRPAFDKLADRAPKIMGDLARRLELRWRQ